MPGKSLDDFKVGQWVGINKSHYPGMTDSEWDFYYPVVKVKEKKFGFIYVSEYRSDSPGEEGSFDPEGLYTAEETEEILYHCSYCGKEGHNRRTCPELGEVEGMEEKYVEISLDPEEMKKDDTFKVKYLRGDNAHYEQPVYSYVKMNVGCFEGKVLESNGSRLAFGHTCTFDLKHWKIIPVQKTGAAKSKTLDVWELVEQVLPVSRLTLLYGPPGTGKTTAGNYLGSPKEVYNLTLTEETPAAELRGHFVPKGQEFIWMDGPALTAFKRGGRLVLNEIDKASGDALTFCHALLDDPGIANITLPYKDEEGNSVSVKPHPDFHVVATMNGEPEDLPDALRDRFAVRIHVNKVHPAAIKALPKELHKIAKKGISGDTERSISIRGWNAFVQLREMIGEENAALAVFGPRANTILNTIKVDALAVKK